MARASSRTVRRALLAIEDGGATDGELLRLIADRRDADAFRALVRRHGPMVLGVCRALLRGEADAVLGQSRNTLKARLERGRAILRARLVRRGLGPAAVLVASAWPATAAAALPTGLLDATITTATGAVAPASANAVALAEGVV